jgi:hypothetical protein
MTNQREEKLKNLRIELDTLLDENLDPAEIENVKEYVNFVIEQQQLLNNRPSFVNNRFCAHNLHRKNLYDKITKPNNLYRPNRDTFLGKLDDLIASILVYVP